MQTKIERSAYAHLHGMPSKGKVLFVIANPSISGQTSWPIGFWGAELTHPLHHFTEAGYEVDFASPNGGLVEMDAYSDPRHESGYSAGDIITLGYLQKQDFVEKLKSTLPLSSVKAADYKAVFLVGGQSPMYTFRHNDSLNALLRDFYESSKPTAAVCHASCALLDAKKSNGEYLVKGKSWTGFANAEEDYVDQAMGMKIQPFRIEDEAIKMADTYFKASAPFMPFAIADGNLITGQQQNSGALVAQLVLEQLENRA